VSLPTVEFLVDVWLEQVFLVPLFLQSQLHLFSLLLSLPLFNIKQKSIKTLCITFLWLLLLAFILRLIALLRFNFLYLVVVLLLPERLEAIYKFYAFFLLRFCCLVLLDRVFLTKYELAG